MGNIVNMILGPFTKILSIIRGLVILPCRLSGKQGAYLIRVLQEHGRIFSSVEDLSLRPLPSVFNAIAWIGFFMSIDIQERMMRAGNEAYDTPVNVTIFRWNKNKLKALLKTQETRDDSISIYILKSYDAEEICRLSIPEKLPQLYMDDDMNMEYIESKVYETMNCASGNVGMILHGAPGTGKSFYVRYLALKYKLPVYVVSFIKYLDNHDLIRMFNCVKGPAIVLFEDFDNHFHGRECLLPESTLTFDTLLNVLDGIYSPKGGIIYAITANDVDKIDPALRYRPSRFKFVKRFDPPAEALRTNILKEAMNGKYKMERMLEITEGLSLDHVLLVRDMMLEGEDASFIKQNLDDISEAEERIRQRQEERRKKKDGDDAQLQSRSRNRTTSIRK